MCAIKSRGRNEKGSLSWFLVDVLLWGRGILTFWNNKKDKFFFLSFFFTSFFPPLLKGCLLEWENRELHSKAFFNKRIMFGPLFYFFFSSIIYVKYILIFIMFSLFHNYPKLLTIKSSFIWLGFHILTKCAKVNHLIPPFLPTKFKRKR